MAKKNKQFAIKKNNAVASKQQTTSALSKPLYQNSLLHKVVLFALVLLLYGWTIRFDYSIDDKFILQPVNGFDTTIHGLITLFKTWFAGADYRPISFLSFWIEKKINGSLTPGFSHFVNVLLFGGILLKIYDLVVVGKFYKDDTTLRKLAILTAILFLVHTNHVSVVANIKARDNLLSMLFGLIACIQLIKFLDSKRAIKLILFSFWMLLALLSKLDAYSFFVMPWLVCLFFRENSNWQKFKKPLFYFILCTICIIISINLLKTGLKSDEFVFSMGFDENPLVASATFINKLSLAFTALFYYFKFLIIPKGYYFFFGYNQIPFTNLLSTTNIVSIVVIVILTFFSLFFYKKNKIYLFLLLFFLCAIFYALNLYVLVAGIVMDKYSFIASLSICMALAAIYIDTPTTKIIQPIKNSLFCIIVLFFTYFTMNRTKDWKNAFTLIEKDMPFLKNSVNANRMAAATYINLALDEEMKSNYNQNFTDSLIAIGENYAIQGLSVYNKVPDLLELRGLCDFYKKNYTTALQYFLKSKEVDSTYLSSINYIGYTYWALGNIDSATYYFKYVINREPVFNYSANNYIDLLVKNNKQKELDSLLNVLINKYPNDSWLNQKLQSLNNNRSF